MTSEEKVCLSSSAEVKHTFYGCWRHVLHVNYTTCPSPPPLSMYVRVVVVEVESGLIMLGEKELQVMITCVCS